MHDETPKPKRIRNVIAIAIIFSGLTVAFLAPKLTPNAEFYHVAISDTQIPSSSKLVSVEASNKPHNNMRSNSRFARVTLSVPRKDFYKNKELSGNIRINCHMDFHDYYGVSKWQKLKHKLTSNFPDASVQIVWPHFTTTLLNTKQSINQERPLNLAADLKRAINDLPVTSKNNKLKTEGYLLLAQLYYRADQNTKADKFLTLAYQDIQTHQDLIPNYKVLQSQIPNSSSPYLTTSK